MKYLWMLFLASLTSCYCMDYDFRQRKSGIPLFVISKGYDVDVCSGKEEIGILFSKEEMAYQISDDSMGYGYIANVFYVNRDSYPHITVGEGSEFEVGRCRFRVVEVLHPYYQDSVERKSTVLYNLLVLQRLSIPNFCPCLNKKVKAYDKKGLDDNWLDLMYPRQHSVE